MIKTYMDGLADQTSRAPLEALGRSDASKSRYAGDPASKLVRRNGAAFNRKAARRTSSSGAYVTGPRPVDGGRRAGGDGVASL